MRKFVGITVLLTSGLTTAIPAIADDIFDVVATTPGETATTSFTKFEDLFDSVQSQNIDKLLSSYTETSAAALQLNVRGLPALAIYNQNSPTLTFLVPSLGISETFTGADRDESEEMFQDYLKANGSGILTSMLQDLAANTPIDPVAGNPNSLLAQMGSSDFGVGTDLGIGPAGAPSSVPGGAAGSSAMSLGFAAGRYSAGDYDPEALTLPIQYTHYMDDPRQQLRITAPLTYIDTQGSESYNLSLGAGYRFPITDDWALTPAARIGVLGSVDVGSAAIVYSGSLSSNYDLYFDDLKLTFGNMYGYYTTQSLDAGDYEIDYDLTNQMTKNGVGLEGSAGGELFQQPTSWQIAAANTYFWGDELYIDSYYDVAISWGTRLTQSGDLMSLRVGLTYTFDGDDYDGLRVDFGFTF